MMKETEQLTVTIAGDTYTLVSDEGSAFVEEAAREVDLLIRQLAARTKSADMRRVAVFVALRMAHQLKRSQQLGTDDQQRVLNLVKLIADELSV